MLDIFAPKKRSSKPVAPLQARGLGTFGGVFTPSLLTILGVIMYLRFGWVVGNVGLVGALLIVTLSTSITFLTSLSIASIATDQQVKIGGAYYMISRSLGIETGGAVGIPLFIAQALSVALYVIGFAESMVEVLPQLNEKWVGIVVTVAVEPTRSFFNPSYDQNPVLYPSGHCRIVSLLSPRRTASRTYYRNYHSPRSTRGVLGGTRRFLSGGNRYHGRSKPIRRPA